MFTIFMFSNQEATESQALSENVASKTQEIITNKKDDGKKYNKIIRKIAHFTLYLILGISVYLFLIEFINDKKLIIFTIAICFVYAISDEVHQFFVPGRSFQILDIILDTIGSLTSLIIFKLIKKH